ncbi:patatin-like phospholipase family protein [Mycolicibacterium hassiacum DSM 44199]|uniref:Patatin-like phospholipase family protein n=1 Tax=Mycolicibacterium hassiacum (strain DSM 44199 / CIP 105218 / JCM 12690 / 3849) TaxID=1122247 RepID=K5BAQ3_MYCHD|nr:patatin-like phospholipase family protein [Mycolicibacterium hassiacum DSM 44199]MDA4088815.1 patatin [Mycolicibacterium hassiacum DSM 44199]VCT91546.1 hypothetical protein MHAS_03261 [Mycolicibacterium hassiacum DSM 44199]
MLAGGGLAGIAWELGVLRGIADVAPDTAKALLDSDVLIGTSAGSAVAGQLTSGVPLDELYERQTAPTTTELHPGAGIDDIAALFMDAVTEPGSRTDKLRRIGAIALSARTVPESVRRDVIAHRLPSHQWPDQELRITAVDTETGELVVFDARCGVELVDAVAASCAVPGVWPPVTIGARRYMDGGVASPVNLGVAADCDTAVVVVPQAESSPSPFGPGVAEEVEAFPGRVFTVFADDASREAFGANPLDPACRAPSAAAGRTQGQRVAPAVTEFLDG